MVNSIDFQVRASVFDWLNRQKAIHGEVLPWKLLSEGFSHSGGRVPLLGANGIFKPAILPEMPISITTSPSSPYADDFRIGEGLIAYKYRGEDPNHRDNRGLVQAMKTQTPLVYFLGTRKGHYLSTYPVFVVSADPAKLTFLIQTDDEMALRRYAEGKGELDRSTMSDPAPRREYVTAIAKRRLHQGVFRDRVLSAYQVRCAVCRLRHGSLLDAAHIIPDNEEDGEPIVSNGLALCKIHHAAFDQNFLGIRPDFKVEVKVKLLEEIDGPMLQHGIKEMHEQPIWLPRSKVDQPDKDRLEARYERFKLADI